MSPENPFGLPVGWTVTRSLLDTTVVTGFNCTACHVGELRVGGKSVRIDGAPNLLRINDLFKDMKTELEATIGDGRAWPGSGRASFATATRTRRSCHPPHRAA